MMGLLLLGEIVCFLQTGKDYNMQDFTPITTTIKTVCAIAFVRLPVPHAYRPQHNVYPCCYC